MTEPGIPRRALVLLVVLTLIDDMLGCCGRRDRPCLGKLLLRCVDNDSIGSDEGGEGFAKVREHDSFLLK